MEMGIAALGEKPFSVLRRKRALPTRDAVDVKKLASFAVGKKPSGPAVRAREVLQQRFQSELVAVRRLLKKALPGGGKGGRPGFLAAEPPAKKRKASPAPVIQRAEAPKKMVVSPPPVIQHTKPPAKKMKASPRPVIRRAEATKKMTAGERELLAADLADLAAELPDHIIELLKKNSRGIHGGEMEIDIHAVQDAALAELQMYVDKFARERKPSRQDSSIKMAEEEEEDVDICGGVSPLKIAPAPAQLDEEEEEEVFVDICGDASPMTKNQVSSSSPASSSDSSDSDSDSSNSSSSSSGSDSDSDSSSSSDSDGDSKESVSISPCPAPAERAAKPAITELIARAKESQQRQRRALAREKSRQELLETERTAMPTDIIDPSDLELLGIARPQDQYMVGARSFLRPLGLFLKDDDDSNDDHHQRQQQTSFFQEEDLEEGEYV